MRFAAAAGSDYRALLHAGPGQAALAFVESMQNETFVISARDSSHKYTPQGP